MTIMDSFAASEKDPFKGLKSNLPTWLLPFDRKTVDAFDLIFGKIQEIITTREDLMRADGGGRAYDDLLQHMLKWEDEDGKKGTFPKDKIAPECFEFLFAGFDTTANTLSFFMNHMALNQHVQDNLHASLKSVNANSLSYEELNSMQYLCNCLSESQRMNTITVKHQYSVFQYFTSLSLSSPTLSLSSLPLLLCHHRLSLHYIMCTC